MYAQGKRKDRRYTYEDYASWPDDERWELIDGEAYAMSPAPGTKHQALVGALHFKLSAFLQGHPCEVFLSPIDVMFLKDEQADTVLQPDLVVVCDKTQITAKGIVGAPAVVIEVLSPSTAVYDLNIKHSVYQREGVKEYWVVSAGERLILKHVLTNGEYVSTPHYEGEMRSEALEGFQMDIAELFASVSDLPD